MRPSPCAIVLATGLLAVAGVRSASAQIENSIEFTTSFPFLAGNATLPAGSYSVTPADDDPQVLEIRGGSAAAIVMTDSMEPKQTPAKTEVVFRRYGNQYVLKTIFVEGSDIGYAAQNELSERRLSKHAGKPTEVRAAAQKTARKTASSSK